MQTNLNQARDIDITCLVSEKLKKNRLMLNISLKELDDIIGINVLQIKDFENSMNRSENQPSALRKISIKPVKRLINYFIAILNSIKKYTLSCFKFL